MLDEHFVQIATRILTLLAAVGPLGLALTPALDWMLRQTPKRRIEFLDARLKPENGAAPPLIQMMGDLREQYVFQELTGLRHATGALRDAVIAWMNETAPHQNYWRQLRGMREFLSVEPHTTNLRITIPWSAWIIAAVTALMGVGLFAFTAYLAVIFLASLDRARAAGVPSPYYRVVWSCAVLFGFSSLVSGLMLPLSWVIRARKLASTIADWTAGRVSAGATTPMEPTVTAERQPPEFRSFINPDEKGRD